MLETREIITKKICNANKCGEDERNKLLYIFLCVHESEEKKTQESPFRNIKKEGNVIPQKIIYIIKARDETFASFC